MFSLFKFQYGPVSWQVRGKRSLAGVVGAAWSVVVRCSRRESTLYRSISPPTNITTSSPLLQQNSHSFKRGGGGGATKIPK